MSAKRQDRQEDSKTHSEEKEEASSAGESPNSVVPEKSAGTEESSAQLERLAALEAREQALTEECSSLKDQYLRKLADYENFRKRMFRERDDSLKFANNALLGDLINILDDFDRAIDSAEHVQDYRTLHDGVVLIRRQFGQMLSNKYNLTTFAAAGEVFDPNIHEAVASEMADVVEPLVSMEFLPGYKLHDRVIRSAKVKVQMPLPKTEASAEASASSSEGSTENRPAGSLEDGVGAEKAAN